MGYGGSPEREACQTRLNDLIKPDEPLRDTADELREAGQVALSHARHDRARVVGFDHQSIPVTPGDPLRIPIDTAVLGIADFERL
jgi:hypothetical protein